MQKKIFLTLFLIFVLIVPGLLAIRAFAASIFSDGFESGDFTAWTSTTTQYGTNTVNTDKPNSGTYGYEASTTSDYGYAFVSKDLTGTTQTNVRIYVEISSTTVDDGGYWAFLYPEFVSEFYYPIVGVENAARNLYMVYYDNSFVRHELVSATTLSLNTYYCVELEMKLGAIDTQYRVYLNGIEVTDLTVTGMSWSYSAFPPNRISIGVAAMDYGSASHSTAYFDDVVVADSYIGPEPAVPPSVTILSPQNTTYNVPDVPLTFMVNETASWMGYSLDGQNNVTVADNTTMTGLSDGSHQVIVYANNSLGAMGSSETVYFTVQTTGQITFDQTGISQDTADTVVQIDGTAYNVTDLPVTFNWTIGSTHSFTFQSPLPVGANTKQYVWTGTSGLSTQQSDSITVSASGGIIVASYKTQYYLTVNSPYDNPTPSSGWFDAGTTVTESVNSPISGATGTQHVCTGWTGTGSVPTTGSASSLTFTLSEASSISWSWKTQYLLTVLTDPSGLSPQPDRSPTGQPGPSNSWWYDESTNVTLTARQVAESNFNNWDIDGISQGIGTNPITVIMNEPHTATAHYTLIPSFLVIFNQTGLDDTAVGTIVTVNGSAKSFGDLPFTQSLYEGSQIEYAYESTVGTNVAGKRFELVDVTGPASPFSVTSNTMLTGNYKTQYYFTVYSAFGAPTPTSGWNTGGSEITASIPSPVLGPSGTRYVCVGWTGTGSVPTAGTGTSLTFTLTEPSSITWNWKTQYSLTVLTEPNGLTQPSRNPSGETGGSNVWWYDASTNVNLTAADVTYDSFDRWNVDGVNGSTGVISILLSMNVPHIATAIYLTPDVAVTDVTPSKTVVGRGYNVTVLVTVEDPGFSAAMFNVTLYANDSSVQNQTAILVPGYSVIIPFTWNTAGFANGNYTLTAYVWPVNGEINTANNNVASSIQVHVGVPGDVSGSTAGVYDGVTNMKDIAYLISRFNTKPSSPNWNPNADVNNDGVCNMKDIAIAILYFNQHE